MASKRRPLKEPPETSARSLSADQAVLDSTSIYLKEIGLAPLLTAEQHLLINQAR